MIISRGWHSGFKSQRSRPKKFGIGIGIGIDFEKFRIWDLDLGLILKNSGFGIGIDFEKFGIRD